jgi:hypothetical protein
VWRRQSRLIFGGVCSSKFGSASRLFWLKFFRGFPLFIHATAELVFSNLPRPPPFKSWRVHLFGIDLSFDLTLYKVRSWRTRSEYGLANPGHCTDESCEQRPRFGQGSVGPTQGTLSGVPRQVCGAPPSYWRYEFKASNLNRHVWCLSGNMCFLNIS